MPERHSTGHSPSSGGRPYNSDRPIHYVRRSESKVLRRSVDGIVGQNAAPNHAKISNYTTTKPDNEGIKPVSNQRSRTHHKPALPRQSRSVVLTRNAVQKNARRKVHVTHRSRMSVLLVMMALVVFAGGTFVSVISWRTNKVVTAKVQSMSKIAEGDDSTLSIPSENSVTPSALSEYSVSPELPRIIRIDSINVEARIKRLGVRANNELLAPSNIYDAGWYDGSSQPGEMGAVLIDGHVSGPTKPGVFNKIGNLGEGDKIEIERGDGKKYTYKVKKIEAVDFDKVDLPTLLKSIESDKPGLNLLTSSSRYDVRTNKYEQRLVVRAVLDL